MPAEMNEQNVNISPSTELSIYDKAFATINYPPFSEGSTSALHRDQFINALAVFNIEGDQNNLMISLYDKKNWGEIRYEFARWCSKARIAAKPAADTKPATPLSTVGDEEFPPWFKCRCLQDEVEGTASPTGAAKGVATSTDNLWQINDLVTYAFIQGNTEATEYRKGLIRNAFQHYASRVNLRIFELKNWDPADPDRADVRIFFGHIPQHNVPGWSFVGKPPFEFRQTVDGIKANGGNSFSSTILSSLIVPKKPLVIGSRLDDAADKEALERLVKEETRTVYHELGHILGLQHEHNSPFTKTVDTPVATNTTSAVTWFDEESVMLYPGQKFRTATKWEAFKRWFDPQKTKFNAVPSKTDLALLGVRISPSSVLRFAILIYLSP